MAATHSAPLPRWPRDRPRGGNVVTDQTPGGGRSEAGRERRRQNMRLWEARRTVAAAKGSEELEGAAQKSAGTA